MSRKSVMRLAITGLCTAAMLGLALNAWAGKKKKPAASASWDAAAAKTLEANVKKMNEAWGKGDLATIKSLLAEESWGTWDRDMMGKPATWASNAEVLDLSKTMHEMMKKSGMKVDMSYTSIKCKASGKLGVCMSTGTTTMSMADGKMPPQKTEWRTTTGAMKTANGWKFTHHHGSAAKAGAMPTQYAKFGNTGEWMQSPDSKLVKAQMVWMNPVTQASAVVLKVEKGFKQERHFHVSNATGVLLEGEAMHTHPDGKKEKVKVGDVFYQPANEIHVTEVTKAGKLVLFLDGPNQTIYVDKDGKPIKHASAR